MKASWIFQGSIAEWQLVKVADSGGGLVANFQVGIPGSSTRNTENLRSERKLRPIYINRIVSGITEP